MADSPASEVRNSFFDVSDPLLDAVVGAPMHMSSTSAEDDSTLTVEESGVSRKRQASDDESVDNQGFKRPNFDDLDRIKKLKKLSSKSTLTITDISEDDLNRITRGNVSKDDFDILCVLGSGAFAKVFLVRKRSGRDAGKLFAMKVLKKIKVVKDSRSITNTKAERHILENVNHPFIVNLCYAFQTDGKLYLCLEFKNGGELFSHLSKKGGFEEDQARFFAAELVLAIEHLHSLGIIYRDLKLENILLGSDGHLALTDFGLSKEYMYDANDRAKSFAGTVEYMSPEMVNQEMYNRSVDWWALGVLIYELITGTPPFNNPSGKDNSQDHIIRRIRRKEPKYPRWFSDELVDLLQGLLCKDPETRLGAGDEDALEIKRHLWFEDLNWDDVLNKKLPPPVVPEVQFDTDTTNFDEYFTRQPAVDSPAAPLTANDLFRGFSFVNPSLMQSEMQLPIMSLHPQVHIPPDSEFLTKYELTDKMMGQGSYSVCFKCLRKKDGRLFAVKIVERSRRDPESEVHILKLCTGYTHIVQLVDVCRDNRHVYIIMELMLGGELFDRIKRKKFFTETEARNHMHVLTNTVRYLHHKSIVHRDLKPENLLFEDESDDAALKIVDFGFAKLIQDNMPLKTPCFTPQYVAPEVLDADPEYDESCDLWSLGVIMYTMLCGYPPFRVKGRSSSSLMEAVKHELKFPEKEWSMISDNAKNLIKLMLNVDPKNRITPEAVLQHPWLRSQALLDSEPVLHADHASTFSATQDINKNIDIFHKVRPKMGLAMVGASSLAKRRQCSKSTDSATSQNSAGSSQEAESSGSPGDRTLST